MIFDSMFAIIEDLVNSHALLKINIMDDDYNSPVKLAEETEFSFEGGDINDELGNLYAARRLEHIKAHRRAQRLMKLRKGEVDFDDAKTFDKFCGVSDFVEYILDNADVFLADRYEGVQDKNAEYQVLKNFLINFLVNLQDCIDFDKTVSLLIDSSMHDMIID